MDLINTYFSKLTFVYLEEKQGYAIYGAALQSMLGGDKQRCVLVFVPGHLGIQSKGRLHELPWQNLQLRMCPKSSYKLIPQTWTFPYTLENIPFTCVNRDSKQTTYKSIDANNGTHGPDGTFPFELMLLHGPKTKSIYQYPNTTNLHWAMDQFSTILNYIGKKQPIEMTTMTPSLPPLPTQQYSNIHDVRPPSMRNPMSSWMQNQNIQDDNFELIL